MVRLFLSALQLAKQATQVASGCPELTTDGMDSQQPPLKCHPEQQRNSAWAVAAAASRQRVAACVCVCLDSLLPHLPSRFLPFHVSSVSRRLSLSEIGCPRMPDYLFTELSPSGRFQGAPGQSPLAEHFLHFSPKPRYGCNDFQLRSTYCFGSVWSNSEIFFSNSSIIFSKLPFSTIDVRSW